MSKEYTNYIIEHCENVRKAYDWLVDHKIIKNEFLMYIVHHDLSKWQDEEYKAYDKYFYGGKRGRDVEEAFNFAWLHHIHNNPHHWQHWVLINDEDGTQALEMPEGYVVEMICDWWAFSHKSGNLKEIFDWYKDHKLNMIMHRNTKVAVEALLDKIKEALKEEEKNGKNN
jgi:hypothetical protein